MGQIDKKVERLWSRTHTYVSNESLRLAWSRYDDLAHTERSEKYEENLQLYEALEKEYVITKNVDRRVQLEEQYKSLVGKERALWYLAMAELLEPYVEEFPNGGSVPNGSFDWLIKAIGEARRWAASRTKV